jgi:hypothetical protein
MGGMTADGWVIPVDYIKSLGASAGNGASLDLGLSRLRALLGQAPDDAGARVLPDGFFVSNEWLAKTFSPNLAYARKELRLMIADEREQTPHVGPTVKPDTVRLATQADEDNIIDLLDIDLQENAAHIATVDLGQVREIVQRGTRQQGGIVAVIDGPLFPVAVVVLISQQWAFSKAFYIHKVFDFVHPDHRRSNHAATLIQFSKWVSDEWSRGFGYTVPLMSSVVSTVRSKAKTRLYRRHMSQVGAVFIYPTPKEA